jgi:hypothetical protein
MERAAVQFGLVLAGYQDTRQRKGRWTMCRKFIGLAFSIAVLAASVAAQTVTGSGTTNTVPVFTGSSTVGNSPITVSGSNVGIEMTVPNSSLPQTDPVIGSAFAADSETFADGSATAYHYGLTWADFSNGTAGPSAMLSGFGGVNLYTGGLRRMTVGLNGNIGIGTASPVKVLEVNVPHATNQDNEIRIGSYYASAFNGIALEYTISSPDGIPGSQISTYALGAKFVPITFPWGTTTTIFNGSVGIGTTTNPQYKLSVNGTIQAKEVLVNTGWSDYVFSPEYRVKPLTEVAAYIKTKHHLPDIPSEAEIKENGVSLGEMQAKLLAKIEELTLQMIQIDEKNTALEKKVEGR